MLFSSFSFKCLQPKTRAEARDGEVHSLEIGNISNLQYNSPINCRVVSLYKFKHKRNHIPDQTQFILQSVISKMNRRIEMPKVLPSHRSAIPSHRRTF